MVINDSKGLIRRCCVTRDNHPPDVDVSKSLPNVTEITCRWMRPQVSPHAVPRLIRVVLGRCEKWTKEKVWKRKYVNTTG